MNKRKIGFIVKTIMSAMMATRNFIGKTHLVVHAEEAGDPPTNTDPPKNDPPSINFEDLIVNARKQEKEKLYPKITQLEGEKKDLIEKNNGHLIELGNKDAKIKELEGQIKTLQETSSKSDDEKVVELNKQVQKLTKELEKAKEKSVDPVEVETRIRNEVSAEFEIKLYRIEKIGGAKDLIPELVTGTTKEEIDASIENSKKRFTEIFGAVVASSASTQVNLPVANTNTSRMNTKDLNLQDLMSMDVNSPEYKALRTKLGLK